MGFEDSINNMSPEEEITADEAIMEINMKIQEIAQMGNNDSEIPTLKDVIEKVKKGDISPVEGRKIAYETLYGKQDWERGH